MITELVQGGASLALPMSFEEYEALGETKHTAYYDQPAHVVARLDAPGPDLLREAPVLVVEVSSRSTHGEDLGRNRELCAVGGAAWYWIVDPESDTVTVLENEGQQFQHQQVLHGGVHLLQQPFRVHLDLPRLFE